MPWCLPCSLRPLGSFIADPDWTCGNSLADADEDAVAATAKSTPFLNRLMVDDRETTDEFKSVRIKYNLLIAIRMLEHDETMRPQTTCDPIQRVYVTR